MEKQFKRLILLCTSLGLAMISSVFFLPTPASAAPTPPTAPTWGNPDGDYATIDSSTQILAQDGSALTSVPAVGTKVQYHLELLTLV